MTAQELLRQIPDSNIYSYYLGEKISLFKKFVSPFREEQIPSLTFFMSYGGTILWRDWGNPRQTRPGGPIDFVMEMYGLSFTEAIERITHDFNVGSISRAPIIKKFRNDSGKGQRPTKDIIIIPRKFDRNDELYWNRYELNEEILSMYDVVPAEIVYVEGKRMKEYDGVRPIYAYLIRDNGKKYYKIYDPLNESKSHKWLYNGREDMLMGFDQLPLNGEIVIVTKSLKDVMCLYTMGYNSFSVQSENYVYSKDLDNKLKERFDRTIIFFDNDSAGVRFSRIISDSFNLQNISIPITYEVKDISDFIESYGKDSARTLMRELINNENTRRDTDN